MVQMRAHKGRGSSRVQHLSLSQGSDNSGYYNLPHQGGAIVHRGTFTNYITARIPAKNSNGVHAPRSKAKKQDCAPAVTDCRGLSTLENENLPTHKVVLEIGAGHLKTQKHIE